MRVNPAKIVKERDAVLRRMTADFERREGCLGLFIRGSVAEGVADPWSDIDATVVVAPEHYEDFTTDRLLAPCRWGDLLYSSGGLGSILCVSHFRPFIKVDLFYYRPEDLIPSPWYARPLIISFDRDGSIGLLVKHSQHLSFQADPKDVDQSINQAISCAHEVLRRIERGELAYAQQILGHFRVAVAEADAFLGDAPPIGLSHFELQCRDLSVLEAVRKSHPSRHERPAVLSCLKRLVEVYRSQICSLDQKFELGRDLLRDAYCLDLVSGWPEAGSLDGAPLSP